MQLDVSNPNFWKSVQSVNSVNESKTWYTAFCCQLICWIVRNPLFISLSYIFWSRVRLEDLCNYICLSPHSAAKIDIINSNGFVVRAACHWRPSLLVCSTNMMAVWTWTVGAVTSSWDFVSWETFQKNASFINLSLYSKTVQFQTTEILLCILGTYPWAAL
jgi:hypothetical protein